MATKQTRRSISVRGTTYDNLRKYCDSHQRSMSDIVEEQLAKLLEGKAAPQPHPMTASVKTAPRPARTVAPRILRAQPAPVDDARGEGRPKPKDAREVIAPRTNAPKGDYRSITF